MTATVPPDPVPPSALLRALASDPRGEVSVDDILAYLGDRALAAAILIFALPILAPLPPGANVVLAIPLLVITGQLMLGRGSLWLPDIIGRKRLRLDAMRGFFRKAAAALAWVERHAKARHSMLCTPRAARFVGFACFVMAILLILPIPFLSLGPALALVVFALGLLKRDGILIAGGWLIVIFGLLAMQLLDLVLKWAAPALAVIVFG